MRYSQFQALISTLIVYHSVGTLKVFAKVINMLNHDIHPLARLNETKAHVHCFAYQVKKIRQIKLSVYLANGSFYFRQKYVTLCEPTKSEKRISNAQSFTLKLKMYTESGTLLTLRLAVNMQMRANKIRHALANFGAVIN